jgi:hypothetical protein
MEPATSWRSPVTMGSEKEQATHERPTFLHPDLHTEWDLAVQAPHNLLLVGTPSTTTELLGALKPHLRAPLHEHTSPTGGSVPQPPDGTLVLLEVARLDAAQQTELLQWLDRTSERLDVQVVSTTSEPLFPLVQAGTFHEDLYYKLNVVLMDLNGAGQRS